MFRFSVQFLAQAIRQSYIHHAILKQLGLKRIFTTAFVFLLLIGTTIGGFSSNDIHVAHAQVASHPYLFVSAENSQWNNYFGGPQVVQVVVADPNINRLDQAYGEPVVTVNGKRLRMAQATDGNWYSYFADRDQAIAATKTQAVNGTGLNFGLFCGPNSPGFNPKSGVDYTQTKGFTIARDIADQAGANGFVNATMLPSRIIPQTCSSAGFTATTPVGGFYHGAIALNHVTNQTNGYVSGVSHVATIEDVIRENRTLNTNPSGFAASSIYEGIWPVIQLYDFSSIPTPVTIDYQTGGGDQIVNLTFDRIPSNLISVTPDRTAYPENAMVFLTMNDPQLNIDPTEEDSWTWGANATNSTLYYMAYNRNGIESSDGTTGPNGEPAMQNLIGNLTTFMFNHNGKFTLNPTAQSVRVVDFESNGKQVLSPTKGDPAIVHTISIGKNSEPITFLEQGGVNTGVLGNWDGGKISNIVTREDVGIRGQSATFSYNGISGSIAGGFSFGSIFMNAYNEWNTGQRIPVTLFDMDANKNSKMVELLNLYNPTVERIPTMVIGIPFDLSGGLPGNEVPQYFSSLPAVTSSVNGTFSLGFLGKHANATNISQDEQFSARPVFNATGSVPFTISNTGGLMVDLKTNMQTLRNTIHDARPGNGDHFKGFNFLNFDFRSFGTIAGGSSTPAAVQVFLVYNTGGHGILNAKKGLLALDHYFNLANSTSLQDFINLNQTQAGKLDSTKVNNLLFSNSIPNGASIGLLFSFSTSGDTLSTHGQPVVADFFSIGINGNGTTSDQRINNAIYRFEPEETGTDTGIFTSTITPMMLNQLNIFDPATYSQLKPISHDVLFVAMQEMLQSDGTAPTVKYLDLGADGVNTEISATKDISSHTGTISFDSKTYKIGDTATITLNDPDLNTNNDLIDIYTVLPNGTDPAADTVGKAGLGMYPNGQPFGTLMAVNWGDIRWMNTCFGASDLTDGGFSGDLFGTGFALVETTAGSGIFTGSFFIPDQFCNQNAKQSTLGKVIKVSYDDFRDASSNIAQVNDTSCVSNSSQSNSRTVSNIVADSCRTTHTVVTPNPSPAPLSSTMTFHVAVADTNNGTKSAPAGTVSWSDGGKGGIFNSPSCTLISSTIPVSRCSISYTTPSTAGPVTITGTYSGDGIHNTSSGISALTVTLRSTSTIITPNPAATTIGAKITFHVKVADVTSGTRTLPTGLATWSDGGAGGKFGPSSSCTLTQSTSISTCAVSYTPSSAGPITITATYSGDSIHSTSSGTSALTVS